MNQNYYLYYYQNDGDVRYIKNTGEINFTSKQSPKLEHRYVIKYLETEKPNVITDKDLTLHLEKFKKWMTELRYNKIQSWMYVDYYHTDYSAVCGLFKKYVKFEKTHEQISQDEYLNMERSSNGALYYMDESYINKPTQCWSYDKKLFYVNIFVSDLMIPTKRGKWKTIKELPKKVKDLKYGFYRVKITCTNKDIYKVFSFSKYNTYLDISLKRAMKLQKKFDMKIELIQDGKDNAYLYKDEDMVSIKDIAGKWHEKVTKLRDQFPKNPYVKFLGNTAWSSANKRKTKWVNDEKLDTLDVTSNLNIVSEYKLIKQKLKKDGDLMYEVLNTHNAYVYNIRLKSWITAKARDIMAKICLDNLESVVRVQTDSVTFTKDIENDDPLFVLESKTTGVMVFENGNKYTNMTTGYKTKNYLESDELHDDDE